MPSQPTKPVKRKTSTTKRTAVRKPAARGSSAKRDTQGPRQRRGGEPATLAEHKREIVALILAGVAIFLVVALCAGDAVGAGGRGVRTGLVYVFGYLAFLLPLTLLGVAVTMVLRRRFWGTYRAAGVLTVVLALLVLVAAGGPPFGSHGEASFERAVFENRAGGLGEALYVGLHRGIGTVGVAILGWLAAVSGVILATGITGVMVAARSRRVADAVKRQAQRSAVAMGRSEEELGWGPGRLGGPVVPLPEEQPHVHLGPVDLVGEEVSSDRSPGTTTFRPFGDGFEEWGSSRVGQGEAAQSLPSDARRGSGPSVVDGAREYADIYGEGQGPSHEPDNVVVLPQRRSSVESPGAKDGQDLRPPQRRPSRLRKP